MLCAASAVSAQAQTAPNLDLADLFAATGIEPATLRGDPLGYALHPCATPPRPLFSALMTSPADAYARLDVLADQVLAETQADGLVHLLAALVVGDQVARTETPRCTPDLMHAMFGEDLPAAVPAAWRETLSPMLCALAYAEAMRQRAFAALPAELDRARLLRQILDGGPQAFEEPDFRRHLDAVEFPALALATQELVRATATLKQRLTAAPPAEAMRWEHDSALGRIVIDSTDTAHVYQGPRPLLLIDMAGDDEYRFTSAPTGVTVLLDLAGNDRYHADEPDTDAAAAVLGLALLWDAEGDDVYTGGRLAQAAALFGAALLIDEQGDDQYRASGFAQGFAVGGWALLADEAGDDVYEAVTHAQASAGPSAAAMLRDRAGADRYLLREEPLLLPSPQLPQRNVSMGQGAGWGWRADLDDGRSLPGGVALLLDGGGDDHYRGEVFAQGVGYWHGAGVLVDDGGDNRFELGWYGLGSATHRGVGALLVRGQGNDDYRVSHHAALGFAHDRSLALVVEVGGDDRYALASNGLGAVLGQGVVLFVEGGGNDHYHITAEGCRGLGAVLDASVQPSAAPRTELAIFADMAGNDDYVANCAQAGDARTWHDAPGHGIDLAP